jgi:hypothetical protein
MPMATWSKAWVCERWLAGTVRSNPVAGMDGCLLRVLFVSDRGFRVGLIARPEESYLVWCV